jgi:hypothetical protein
MHKGAGRAIRRVAETRREFRRDIFLRQANVVSGTMVVRPDNNPPRRRAQTRGSWHHAAAAVSFMAMIEIDVLMTPDATTRIGERATVTSTGVERTIALATDIPIAPTPRHSLK